MNIEQLEKQISELIQDYANNHGRMIESISVDWHEGFGMSPYLVRLSTHTITCSSYHGTDNE